MARHSKNAETGTMQRRRLKAARKLGFSVIVSARALKVCFAILSSFDQDGISPQRAGSAKRWPSWTWMIGAMLVGRTSGLLYGSGSASKMK
jgi:hypothetical protein